ncbi:MAG: type I restriction endonuclease [Dehalococcoidales bacterium]|jgi:predicted type IV restriction endonuclease
MNKREEILKLCDRLRNTINEFSDEEDWHNELSTRYILIDPILRMLGWNTENPKQVRVSNIVRLKPTRFSDYTLFDNGKAIACIEAKRYGIISFWRNLGVRELSKKLKQLTDYCKVEEARLGISTDGESWFIVDCKNKNRIEKIDLWDTSNNSFASTLLKLRPTKISTFFN